MSTTGDNIPDFSGEMSIPQAPPGYKSGFVGIIGRPNVGKKLLLLRQSLKQRAIGCEVS